MPLIDIHLPKTIARALNLPANNPRRQQLRVLRKLLKKARHTAFGQKYFFVPYNIMKAGIYFSVAMGCWLTSKFLTAQVNDYSHAVPLFINVSLLFIFTVFVYLVEVKKIFAKKYLLKNILKR
mgnify:CR=1 FL=1